MATLTKEPPERVAYRIAEISAMTGINRRTLDRMKQSGKMPKPDLDLGKIALWKRTTIEKWLSGK
jgi:predicted DNA-binding transcriptional regulator AlpA